MIIIALIIFLVSTFILLRRRRQFLPSRTYTYLGFFFGIGVGFIILRVQRMANGELSIRFNRPRIVQWGRRGMILLYIIGFLMGGLLVVAKPEKVKEKNVNAMYVLGDSSVDCGDNTLFYSLVHRNLSLVPCNGSDSTLLPHLLAQKIGLPYITPFYSQNGTIDGILSGLNFGSAQATILKPADSLSYQSLNQQLRQAFETFQLLELQLGEETAQNLIKSSIFYLSFGKNDYIDLFLQNSSGVMLEYSGEEFAHILVRQMTHALRNIYDANARKIICVGVLPLGCTPRTRLEWHNLTGDDAEKECVKEINELVMVYNTMLEDQINSLNEELQDAKIIFCNVYKGLMDIINNPKQYGFEDVNEACCGLGWNGAVVGCLSSQMACDKASRHVWWDIYNPTEAVNLLLADSAWSDHPIAEFCSPFTVHDLVSSVVS